MGVISQRLAMNYYPMMVANSNNKTSNSSSSNKKPNHHHSDLLRDSENSSESDSETDESENFIELRSCIKGRMTDSQGTQSVLLTWFPENV